MTIRNQASFNTKSMGGISINDCFYFHTLTAGQNKITFKICICLKGKLQFISWPAHNFLQVYASVNGDNKLMFD